MKIGVNLLNFGPSITAESVGRWGQVVEGLGYHGIFMSDHVAITPSVAQRYPEPFFDALTTLAYLAGRTTRIDLGTTIIVLPYRHPILLARQVANLDVLSGGRFIFGIGIGNAADEFAALGVPHNRRGAWSDDMLDAMKALWTSNGEVTYQGRHIQFERISAIRTAQQPYPQLWVGGNSDSALLRAVRHEAAWHPINQSVAALRDRWLPALQAAAESAAKPVPPLMPRIRLKLSEAPDEAPDRAPGTGSLNQVHDDLRGLEALGAQYVVLDWYNGPDFEGTRNHERAFAMLALLAEQVADLAHETVR